MKPREIRFNKHEGRVIDLEFSKPLKNQVIVETSHSPGEYLSTVFVHPKKDGSFGMILNLKKLNEWVEYHHFKMDTFQTVLKVIRPMCYMASVDLRHAYYTVPIANEFQHLLRFEWKGKLFQYICLPDGLASAPRVFTKLLKPVYATLRQMGHISVAYIDDSYLQAATARACEQNVHDTVSLFTRLGFTVHPDKSVLKPTQELVFLEFVLNSRTMTFSLTRENKIV